MILQHGIHFVSVGRRLEGKDGGRLRMRCMHKLSGERDCRPWRCEVAGDVGLEAIFGG